MTVIDETAIQEFMGRAVTELGAALGVAVHRVGDQLGIWKAMAGAGPLTSVQVAKRTGCAERYIREWLSAEAAAGYLDYDPENTTFTLGELAAAAMADEGSPLFLSGAWQFTVATYHVLGKVAAAFTTGEGVPWADHSDDLFEGVERFFRPTYNASLVTEWLPALDGVADKLERGARVADVGCGHGASTIILARAYPRSTFVGYDAHDASIARARKAAAQAGVADRVTFEVATAQSYPGSGYDLVAFFDCLHDMGDPEGAARHVRDSLADDGTWLLVEPYSNATLVENLNPVGRAYYSTSTLVCLPSSLADHGHRGLGNQVPDATLAEITAVAGFTRFRRAQETVFNRVFEVRP
jgi:SAM-dependent methyltransferase